jgi:hypothetical protein
VARKAGSTAGDACKRSCTKNSTSVAGTALAVPLSTNTANRRRKAGWRRGVAITVVAVMGATAPGSGTTARLQAHHPKASNTAKLLTVAPSPRVPGNTAAISTPSSDSASRQATTRLRWASVPPSRAPHDWCATLITL